MSDRRPSEKWDVFLAHSSLDEDWVHQIDFYLERGYVNDRKVRCLTHYKDQDVFKYGHSVFDNICRALECSRMTFVLLTENSLKSGWVTLETILSLEKCQRTGQLFLQLVLIDIDETQAQYLRRGVLAMVPVVSIKSDTSDWDKLMEPLKVSPASIEHLLPSGNIAFGCVYSHVIGYLEHVLPVLQAHIKKSQCYKENKGRMSLNYYMLLPDSTNLPTTLCDGNANLIPRIEFVENLCIEVRVAGKDRKYDPSIYRLISKNKECYYFVGEFPHVLSIMNQMKKKDLADADIPLQIQRFYFTMWNVLNCHGNLFQARNVRLLQYNDAEVSALEVLLQWLQRDTMECDDSIDQRTRYPGKKELHVIPAKMKQISKERGQQFKYDVSITVVEADDDDVTNGPPESVENSDQSIAMEIFKELERNNLTYTTGLGGSKFDYIVQSRWNVFVLSEKGLCKQIKHQCMEAIAMCVGEECRLKVIPILNGMDGRKLPHYIKWVTYLQWDEQKKYLKQLIQVVKGEHMTVEMRIPAGDVATGLTWGYAVNYLPVTLQKTGDNTANRNNLKTRMLAFLGKPETCQRLLKENVITVICLERMYALVPKDCDCSTLIDSHPCIVKLGFLEPVIVDSAGAKNRRYFLWVYMVRRRNKQGVCFLAEYSTPANTLYHMCHSFQDAGLSQDNMEEQAKDFATMTQNVIESQKFKTNVADLESQCKFVYYDGMTEPLSAVLEEQVARDITNQTCTQFKFEVSQALKNPLVLKQSDLKLYSCVCAVLISNWLDGKIGHDAPTEQEENRRVLLASRRDVDLEYISDKKQILMPVSELLIKKGVLEYFQQITMHRAWVCWTYVFLDHCKVKLADNMDKQVKNHDLSKYTPPEILGYFIMFGRGDGLRKLEDPREQTEWGKALDHHYSHNPHHPEHFYKKIAGWRETDSILEKAGGEGYLQESIIDMLACRGEWELSTDRTISVRRWFDIHADYFWRYSHRDRKWVQKTLREWREKAATSIKLSQGKLLQKDMFNGKMVVE